MLHGTLFPESPWSALNHKNKLVMYTSEYHVSNQSLVSIVFCSEIQIYVMGIQAA